MAIKGKSKSRSAKAVTPGPKPAYVPVKKPLLARRGFWIAVAAVLGTALGIALVAGFVAERNQSRENALQEKMAAAVNDYRDQLEPILAAVGQPVAPSGYEAFPQMTAAVEQLESDSEDAPADVAAIAITAQDTVDGATSAIQALDAVDETALISGQGFSEEFVLYVINTKGNMLRSMRLYVQVGELMSAAAEAKGAERAALVARARGVMDVASEVFARGYIDYVEAQTKAGVFEPSPLGLPAPTGTT